MRITERTPPEGSLLAGFPSREGHYADCFEAQVDPAPDLATLVEAFYTQWLFKAERIVLRVALAAGSSDRDARALAQGHADRFAVWRVAGRRADEILLSERSGRTMSWLGVAPGVARFGTVIVPVRDRRGRLVLGPVFDSLIGPHKLYSRALLAGAVRRAGAGFGAAA